MTHARVFKWMTVVVFCLWAAPALAHAGQVVTPELRQWAHQAIEQEKSLNVQPKADAMAVLYFNNRSGDAALNPLQKGLTVMLISDLARLQIMPLIERAELQALVEEIGLGQSGLVEPDSAPRIGRLLGAKYIVGGAFNPAQDNRLNIQSHLLDVVPENVVSFPDAEGRLQELLDLEKRLLEHIVASMKLDLSENQKAALKKPFSNSFEALMAFFMGIDAGDQGRYEEASRYYGTALKNDPQFAMAKEALKELKALKLIDTSSTKGRLLRKTRQQTSFSTTLGPALPLARVPSPAGAPTNDDQRIDGPTHRGAK